MSVWGSIHTCICVHKGMQVLKIARSVLASGARDIGGCEPATLAARDRTWSISPGVL